MLLFRRGDAFLCPVDSNFFYVFEIFLPTFYTVLQQIIDQIIRKMQHVCEEQNRFDLGGSQRLTDICFCNEQKLGSLFSLFKFPQLIQGIGGLGIDRSCLLRCSLHGLCDSSTDYGVPCCILCLYGTGS